MNADFVRTIYIDDFEISFTLYKSPDYSRLQIRTVEDA